MMLPGPRLNSSLKGGIDGVVHRQHHLLQSARLPAWLGLSTEQSATGQSGREMAESRTQQEIAEFADWDSLIDRIRNRVSSLDIVVRGNGALDLGRDGGVKS